MNRRRPGSRTRFIGMALALLAGVEPLRAGELAVVTNRVVYPGETIAAAMLEEVPLVRGNRKLGPIFQQAGQLHGKVARRTILPGRLIPPSSVRDAFLVQAGAPVEVTLVDKNLVITVTAMPLEAGAAGDVVKLRNIDSGRVFSGVVMTDGTVRVGAS
ncbi:flagellar basal body P-ring formation chaperone FlgA [Mesorhizobium sp. L-8-10]|uniref:flagellar basal body P-ring formation chaperone FlgA n=1 Tax=Mesorhizobium sp. L-8-10 TaxID=2744523 RepID=UPI001FD1E26C|nr:flagellar basal body P-ring formation chaperone FlgA [Mesorhizobium sp. L-8-10]